MAMTLVTTNSGTNSTGFAFTGIDSTYKLYIFKFYDINPATDGAHWTFNGSDDTSSWSYDITKTTTAFQVYHAENDSSSTSGMDGYQAGYDLAQSTAYQTLAHSVGSGADESCSGELFLFNPSNTTYVKHFYATTNSFNNGNHTVQLFTAGYFNATAAITAINFDMNTGNFDGTVKMYGVG